MKVTDEMVTRFLGWSLPKDFAPDCGITFTPVNHPNCWPVGTNVFTADQARQMLEHVLGCTRSETQTTESKLAPRTAPTAGSSAGADLPALGDREHTHDDKKGDDSRERPAPISSDKLQRVRDLLERAAAHPGKDSARLDVNDALFHVQELLRSTPSAGGDRERAAAYIVEASGGNLGAGDDPVGFLITAHAHLAAQLSTRSHALPSEPPVQALDAMCNGVRFHITDRAPAPDMATLRERQLMVWRDVLSALGQSTPSASGDSEDAERYRWLRVKGVAIDGTDAQRAGLVRRCVNLDEEVDSLRRAESRK